MEIKTTKSQDYKSNLFTKASLNASFLSGVLAFLMYPFILFGYHFPDMGFFAWIFLVPLLIGIHRHKFAHKFVLAFICSMIAHYGTFYWLITAMQKFGGLNFFQSFATMTLLCIFFSMVFALFLSLASWVNHIIKVPLFLLLPVFMTTRDLLLHHFPFNGFPWGAPPYALGDWLQFFQWVDHTGIFGLSFFIYLINGLFAGGMLLFIHRKQVDKMVSRLIVVCVLIVLSIYLSSLSSQAYEKNKIPLKSLNIALVQGNIPQDQKWDPFYAQDILNNYFKLTHKAVKDGADFVVWPETSYPFGLRYPKLLDEKFLNKERLSTNLLIGAFVAEKHTDGVQLFNSIVQINTKAEMLAVYRKMHLVPFGEYLPFKEIFKHFPTVRRAVGEVSRGHEAVLFDVLDLKVGSLICFEDIFPSYARALAKKKADILINYTNDAWYGDTSAQHQHLVFSQFRALENRLFLLRATNTGMTAIINPRGEVFDKLAPFKNSYLLHNIKVDRATSFYSLHGDNWVFGIAVIFFMLFLYAVIKRLLGPVKIRF